MGFIISRMTFGEKDKKITLGLLRKPRKDGLTGVVMSSLFSQNIAILVNDDALMEEGLGPGNLSVSEDGKFVSVVITSEIFHGIKRNTKLAGVTLFHELGHYFNDHSKDGRIDTEEYLQARYETAKEEDVFWMEQEADRFAAEYLGIEYTCEGLRELIEYTRAQAQKGIVTDTEETELSVAELERRIEILKRG